MRIGAQFVELRVINQLNKYRCEFKTPSNFKTQATFTNGFSGISFFLEANTFDCP